MNDLEESTDYFGCVMNEVMLFEGIRLDTRLRFLDGFMEACFIHDMLTFKKRQKMIDFIRYLSKITDVKDIKYLN